MSVKRGEGKVLETIDTYTKILEYPTEAFLGLTTESVPLNMWAGEVREKDGETFLKFTIGMEKEDTVIQPYIIFGVNRDLAQQKKCIAVPLSSVFKIEILLNDSKVKVTIPGDRFMPKADSKASWVFKKIKINSDKKLTFPETETTKLSVTAIFEMQIQGDGEPNWKPNCPSNSPAFVANDREKHADLSDVTITAAGDQSFQCHKIQLASRSDVFAAMFSHDMKENNNGEVRINDFEADTVNDFINFMYEGKVDDTARYNLNLLRIADKYNVQVLKRRCEEYLSYNLDDSNVMTCWITSDRNNAAYLKVRALSYIIQNWDKKEGFADYADICMNNPGLLLELMKVKK